MSSPLTMDILQNNFTITEEEMQVLFLRLAEDYKKSYKTRELIYNLHKKTSEEKAERLRNCGLYITKYDSMFGSTLLMNKCHIRFCPICEKQNTMKRFISLTELLSNSAEIKGTMFHYIFTCKNCKAENLRATVQNLSAGIRMFMRHYNIKDYTRRIEVTYNKAHDEYHPHAHCIVMVEKGALYMMNLSYEDFINNLRALRMYWRECCIKNNINVGNFDYQELYARPLKNKRELIECVKYSVKPISITEVSIKIIDNALRGLKLFNGAGIFRKISTENKENIKSHKNIISNAEFSHTYARTFEGYKLIKYNDCEKTEEMKQYFNL